MDPSVQNSRCPSSNFLGTVWKQWVVPRKLKFLFAALCTKISVGFCSYYKQNRGYLSNPHNKCVSQYWLISQYVHIGAALCYTYFCEHYIRVGACIKAVWHFCIFFLYFVFWSRFWNILRAEQLKRDKLDFGHGWQMVESVTLDNSSCPLCISLL